MALFSSKCCWVEDHVTGKRVIGRSGKDLKKLRKLQSLLENTIVEVNEISNLLIVTFLTVLPCSTRGNRLLGHVKARQAAMEEKSNWPRSLNRIRLSSSLSKTAT
jgi:hypothetical protein